MCVFFFFKQKTAYEMRISDWSSDVCSSDLYRLCLGRRVSNCPYRCGKYKRYPLAPKPGLKLEPEPEESKRGPEPEPKPNDSTAPGAWLRRPLALFDHSVQAVGIQGRLSILDALPQVFQGMAQFANPFFLAGGMRSEEQTSELQSL